MSSFNLIPLYCQFGHKVELGSRAGALRQMLLDLLEDPQEIRRICIMGRNCTLNKRNDDVECSLPLDKQIADGKLYILEFKLLHSRFSSALISVFILFLFSFLNHISLNFLSAEEEEEIEMLLENYLQR